DYIFIKSEHQLVKLNLNNILYVEGFKDYLKIFTTTSTKPNLTLKSMKSMEETLHNKGFVRIHRSFMVSIPQISAVRGNRVKVGEKFLPIGDNYKSGFSEKVLMGHV
ncbi:MAG: LytR/AlgR family response regulator transcription factor, partial [Flammeovirgaceae bacterium]